MSTLYPSGLHYCKEQSGVCDNYEQVVFEIAAADVCNLQIQVCEEYPVTKHNYVLN
jgi:hypothetical protein